MHSFLGNTKILKKACRTKLLICDCDGVMTDGLIYVGSNGEEIKTFNIQDGYGIRCIQKIGVEVAIISGGVSKVLENRSKSLGIKYLYQGCYEKEEAYFDLINKANVEPKSVAYIGDDVIDLPVMLKVGFSIAVPNSHHMILQKSDYITRKFGGSGAVREVCDIILFSKKNKDVDLSDDCYSR
ncbi:3-deoxy-manno-octulosonate-8-phosphatase KdsC [Candidatus Riesia pediculischaeffi]|uniref:3-deoxy-D-manno-octulosonate 8-phosphate phosphatase KdsC n=2 Tax=Candidatus Riesia pediculischaeffi TaxID=428411 RepID=A0A1V0HKZ6_9ENTR|nr:3-deoxy-manno-octulosonate-8-phosphatase KdsC [Candidatus Riesia pediculischaeffi]ARC53499.1 3-deoxy-D-manno-octulosonate 8-phosphate phosphatase [Candidatus Riesia pediculischaeffi]KIE64301.1 3-deoxy-D-manno-octulosonate 8-phosphate phosphatase [Candidatus Riesia pediculischaeffi PTSU]